MRPDEEWVDGSWTVDCVCGVNFDDGKEMVNCDECGVWVHTRCSLYVKGDELFACHKCKSKSNDNDTKETEIAQLLLEFPTKSLRVENSGGQSLALSPPFRPCTEIPMEERVHVQGVPGGDLALFERFSSVFSRQLWKCSGYVPKKFRFQYREFPWWDEKENVCENVNKEDNGGGVLCSMSKENAGADPTYALVGMKGLDDKGTNDYKLGIKDRSSSRGAREMEMKHCQSSLNKDKSLLRPLITTKRRKELLRASEDRITKRLRSKDKEEDEKKDSVHKTVLRRTIDYKPWEARKDRDPKGFTTDVESVKNEKSKEIVLKESIDISRVVKQEEKVANCLRIVLKSSTISDPSVLKENRSAQ